MKDTQEGLKLPTKQTPKNDMWTDEKGIAIPFTRTTRYERVSEANAHRILKGAISLSKALAAFKETVTTIHQEQLAAFAQEKGVDLSQRKGNHTWHSFDRGIRVSADAQERVTFDDMTISAAREKFNEFLAGAVSTESEAVGELIRGAFENTNGKLDPKRVMELLRYRSKIKHELYQQATTLIEESIRRSYSKTYYTVAVRQEDGSYEAIKLDFAAL